MTENRTSLLHQTQDHFMHNARVKHYPDGSSDIMVASGNIFREPGWELSDEQKGRTGPGGENDPRDSLDRAKRRARAAVQDLALSNDFEYFVTLTLDRERIDRYDPQIIVRTLSTWADNRVRRNGLKYVLIPEYHGDGAVHFHGFFNDALPMVDSGTVRVPGSKKPKRPRSDAQRAAWLEAGGQVVYNCPAWRLGFSTAISLYGDRRAAIGYTVKYITKAQSKIGGRWYYSGGNLSRPDVEYTDADYEQFLTMPDAHAFTLDNLNAGIVKLTVGGWEHDI